MGLNVNGWPGMFPQHRLASGVLARAVRSDETDVKDWRKLVYLDTFS